VLSKSLFITMMLLALVVFPALHAVVAQDTKSPQTIKGELVLLAGEVGIVKDSSGKATHLNVSKATKVEGNPKPGDKVEVAVTGDGQALSIKPSQ
jgi:hypothetical protein